MVDAAKLLGTARSYKATTMFGSPALLNRVSRHGVAQGITLPTMKRVISAGAPVPATTLARFSRLLPEDAEIFTPYGATEALPVCSIGSREILAETAAASGEGRGICVGRPVKGLLLAVIAISDTPVDLWDDALRVTTGEIGEIVVRGPQVTAAYFNRPEATRLAKITAPDGGFWHRMGDLGYLDGSGRVWFCGRKSHRVQTTAGTLCTIPVEGVFNPHPEVFRTALVGVGLPGHQRPVLCVELEQGVKASMKEKIRTELLEIGAAYTHTVGIKDILFHPAFPVDIRHNAKIFREKLAVWAERKLK
jgi:acyl-CoA synthetase (AMP-forming)/AMP-acid ligase II